MVLSSLECESGKMNFLTSFAMVSKSDEYLPRGQTLYCSTLLKVISEPSRWPSTLETSSQPIFTPRST